MDVFHLTLDAACPPSEPPNLVCGDGTLMVWWELPATLDMSLIVQKSPFLPIFQCIFAPFSIPFLVLFFKGLFRILRLTVETIPLKDVNMMFSSVSITLTQYTLTERRNS